MRQGRRQVQLSRPQLAGTATQDDELLPDHMRSPPKTEKRQIEAQVETTAPDFWSDVQAMLHR